ncbi:Uncharacterized protein conserved in bacteria [Neisseria canis]|uniref:Uncharacterized protein conserved in bacteria n=2 Tax=Neisseria canis TaxID=493 RepID=A0A448D7Q2_9NEIS|nr:Uncharacterized protein conserved in bacteria [Neisseria canis]
MPHYHCTPSRRKIRKMNARQRKKFYVGEYQNLVFSVRGSLMPEYQSAAYFEQFINDVIDWVHANSMCLVSGGTAENFFIMFDHTKHPPHNITPMQRQMLIEWLVARKDMQHLRAGKLIDGFYGDETEYNQCNQIHK